MTVLGIPNKSAKQETSALCAFWQRQSSNLSTFLLGSSSVDQFLLKVHVFMLFGVVVGRGGGGGIVFVTAVLGTLMCLFRVGVLQGDRYIADSGAKQFLLIDNLIGY